MVIASDIVRVVREIRTRIMDRYEDVANQLQQDKGLKVSFLMFGLERNGSCGSTAPSS